MRIRKCLGCAQAISDNRRIDAKFCSKDCLRKHAHGVYLISNPRSGLSTGKTGAISELLVAADLLRLGFDVFRAVSQSCSCDIVALRNGVTVRIEVRTGQRNSSGGLSYSKAGIKADHVAIVSGDMIFYEPRLA